MTDDLLPCPFCGGTTFSDVFKGEKDGMVYTIYQHPESDCQLSRHLFQASYWNRRAPISSLIDFEDR